MRSIRRALFWRLFGGALVLLLAGAALLYAGAGWLLTEQFDTTLRTKLATFVSLTDEEGYNIELGLDEKAMPEYFTAAQPEYFELWLLNEPTALYRSQSLGSGDLPRAFGTEAAPLIWDTDLPDGRGGRAIGAEFVVRHYEPGAEDPGPAHVVLVLARGRGTLDRGLASLLGGTIAGILLLLGAGVFLGRAAVKRGLGPLDDLARHVGAIDDPLLAPRFSAEEVPEELAALVESHNQMLARIRAAFERERRTTANIAHELRTPITEFMILAETAQRYPADAVETARRLGELREIGERMSAWIATLLELARMESGHVPLEIESIDLAEIVHACWSPLSTAAAAKSQALRAQLGKGPLVRADRAALSILLANLLSNAVDHGPAGAQIACDVENGGECFWLVISNAANGLAPQDLDKLTEPFWRASRAREDRSHAGIGLTLARRLAELLELELSFRLEKGVFQARLSLPAA